MVKARKYIVKKKFNGFPKREDYELVEYELPPIQNGEILVKTEWISVDPYQKAFNSSYNVPYDQFSFQVGTVLETKNPKFPVGTIVVTHKGWCDYTIVKDGEQSGPIGLVHKLPNLGGLPASLGVGAVGMPGVTAYFGFLDICKPKPGETVVVTRAAGAVGHIVGQIAKIKGCKVIGFAGSDDKCNWLEKELGFDKAINYKTAEISKALKEAAPNGVDCYFDNVGGEISSIIIYQMNKFGRVSVCGSVSAYDEDEATRPKSSNLQPPIVYHQLKIQGFIIFEWIDKWQEALDQLAKWIKSGQLKTGEHVTNGFENVFDAFVGMFAGENTGKAVVKV